MYAPPVRPPEVRSVKARAVLLKKTSLAEAPTRATRSDVLPAPRSRARVAPVSKAATERAELAPLSVKVPMPPAVAGSPGERMPETERPAVPAEVSERRTVPLPPSVPAAVTT